MFGKSMTGSKIISKREAFQKQSKGEVKTNEMEEEKQECADMQLRLENESLRSQLEHTQNEFKKMRAAFDESIKIKSQYEQLIIALMGQDADTRAKVESVMQNMIVPPQQATSQKTSKAKDGALKH